MQYKKDIKAVLQTFLGKDTKPNTRNKMFVIKKVIVVEEIHQVDHLRSLEDDRPTFLDKLNMDSRFKYFEIPQAWTENCSTDKTTK